MKKKQLLILLPLILFAGIAAFSAREFVTAQSAGQGLEVSPPSQETTVDPSGTTTIKAKLRNRSNNTLPVSVRVEDFTAKGEDGQVDLTTGGNYSVIEWTTVTPDSFELAPGEEQEVTATIDAPADAAGGRFGSFVFSVKGDATGENATAVTQEIASLFLVKVNGPVDEKLSIKSFNAPAVSEFGPIQLTTTFANEGNVHVKTYGLINVTDMFGNKVADVIVPPTNVFPSADRAVKAQLDKQFLFGNFTATAVMYYGASNQNITATTSFFVFPLRIAAIVFAILFIIFLMRKRLKKAGKALFK